MRYVDQEWSTPFDGMRYVDQEWSTSFGGAGD
jgi:hypothetical protein